ncbi:MAG: NAD(P)H-hydrate dehydratase [Okeania sp. SIO3I5]|uniref:NAD(P)H-hydrate dehydratase n=1 Tax=Okeania sp. SIO3I5 TaxID=2607805 RepID=UPI0013BB2D1B|nr:NAD(P)H-hydrate dehydratase [Okeania sp. SIO3I5]NEQ41827.1 NAD(P)H-hydrate dehydratase [Okeania sp. SIO3I5]
MLNLSTPYSLLPTPYSLLPKFVVTAAQMRQIEERIFIAGMPVAALMEKVAGLVTRKIEELLNPNINKIGVLVGPGHNGGDALVIARELYFQGYEIIVYCPITKLKELTNYHAKYLQSLGVNFIENISPFKNCDLLIDGLFGFGLEREISGDLAESINQINSWQKQIFSIDLPSGIHTDTGAVLGIAICATHTFCLGLWKQAFLQDQALEYIGTSELIDFDIPLADITAILGEFPTIERITKTSVRENLPLPFPPTTYKYKNGNLLLITGSHPYTGAAILTGLAARATGVGMLSIAVPESIKNILNSHLPEALIIGCPETETGAIKQLPENIDLSKFETIACGPGLTTEPTSIIEKILSVNSPLVLDADALNICGNLADNSLVNQRQAPTIITPHLGEFKRLFPHLTNQLNNRILTAQKSAENSNLIVVFKGAKTIIANSQKISINPESTPALARGGSGDVLTGLVGGLLAITSTKITPFEAVKTAVLWHAQAAILAAKERTELGVDAFTLTQYLIPAIELFLGVRSQESGVRR